MNIQNGQAMQAPASRVASPGKGRTAACGRNQSKMPTNSREKPKTMLCWLGILAEEARLEGRQRRAEIWRTTSNSFSRFLGGKDIGLRQMEGRLVQRYENWLQAGGLCPNTCSFYLRNLRSACNKAVKGPALPEAQAVPFRRSLYRGSQDPQAGGGREHPAGHPGTGFKRTTRFELCPQPLPVQLLHAGDGVRGHGRAAAKRPEGGHPVLCAAQDGQAAVRPLGRTDAGGGGSPVEGRGSDGDCCPEAGKEAAFPPRCREGCRWRERLSPADCPRRRPSCPFGLPERAVQGEPRPERDREDAGLEDPDFVNAYPKIHQQTMERYVDAVS